MNDKTLGKMSDAELESLGNDYELAAKAVEAELARRYGPEHAPTPIVGGIEGMADGELAALLESYGREAEAVEVEQKRRRDRVWGIRSKPLAQPRMRGTAKEPCPSCGRSDAVANTKTLYDSPDLAHGGNVVCTAAICECGAWFDPSTGKPIDLRSVYTY